MYNPYLSQPKPMYGDDIKTVNGLSSAERFEMFPNSRAILLDANEDIFYLKTTDAAGVANIDTYKFELVPKQVPVLENPKYITRDELKEVLNEFYTEQQQQQSKRIKSSTTKSSTEF